MAVTDLPICPGLFYGSRARDGVLSRMRIPGGILNVPQCLAIADLADRYSTGYLQVTNRANLQVRTTDSAIPPSIWQDLQDLGLASGCVEIDPIRNIMSSPTAGIDRAQLVDTRLLVKAWDNHLQTHPELSELSPKFSVGFDGGESVSIGNLRNDILLKAEINFHSTIVFRLFLNGKNTGITVELSECISALAALANTYLEYSKYRPIVDRKNRACATCWQIGVLKITSIEWKINCRFPGAKARSNFPIGRSNLTAIWELTPSNNPVSPTPASCCP